MVHDVTQNKRTNRKNSEGRMVKMVQNGMRWGAQPEQLLRWPSGNCEDRMIMIWNAHIYVVEEGDGWGCDVTVGMTFNMCCSQRDPRNSGALTKSDMDYAGAQ